MKIDEEVRMKTMKCCRQIFLTGVLLVLTEIHSASSTMQMTFPDGVRIVADDVTEEPPFSCSGREDGVYPDFESNCTVYYRCIIGVAMMFQCEEDSVFDEISGECVSREEKSCVKKTKNYMMSADCNGKPDGVYIDYESQCHNYYRCESGSRVDFTCGQHMIFELRSMSCVDSNLSVCHVPTCQGKENGYYSLPDSDSEFFYLCVNQSLVSLLTCPSGQQFDPSLGTCQTFPFTPIAQPNCSEKADGFYPDVTSSCRNVYYCQAEQVVSLLSCSTGFSFDTKVNHCREEHLVSCSPESSSTSLAVDCQNRADGYYPEFASACQSFYYCYDGKKIFNISCPEGKLFNIVLEKCDDASNVVCSAMTLPALQHFCFGKKNGFYPNPVTGCKSYVFCQEGRVTSEVTCPKGKVFNITIEDCASSGIVAKDNLCSRMLVEDCFGKSDGYHPFYSFGCQKYFYCGGERKLLEFECPKGQLFHPLKKQCMNASRVTCEQHGFSPECAARNDGYYPNPNSNCRSFYYCRNGRKMNELNCPPNQAFDANAQACTDEYISTCSSTPVCSSDGLQGDVRNGCHSYYYCYQGQKLSTFDCPMGKIFDVTSKACVIEALAKCHQKWSDVDDQCTNKSDGFFSFILTPAYDTHMFYHCREGEVTSTFECPPGAIFDEYVSRCVPKNNTRNCYNGFCCRGLPNAFYAVNQSLARDIFYSCFQENLVVHRCPKGLVYNWKTVSCDNPNPFEPIPLINCTQRSNSFATNPSYEHRLFSVCINGVAVTTGFCPWNQVFNTDRGLCIAADKAFIHSLSKTDCSCSNHSDGYYVNIKNSLTSYCLCQNKTCLNHFRCSKTLIFDEKTKKCKNVAHKSSPNKELSTRSQYSSLGSSTTPVLSTSTRAAHLEAKNDFSHKEFIGETSKSTPVSLSSTFKPPSLVQKPTIIFPSPKLKTYSSPIPSNKFLLGDASCQGKMNEVFADVSSGCRQFYICFREVKMLFTCSEDRLFNPETKTCDSPNDVICQQTKSSGMDNPSNDIRRVDSSKMDFQLFHRPETGSGLNGKFACLPYETGFFPEYSSGCRDFYVCFRGIQKTYSCPDGLLFSPATKSCDAPANVNCTPFGLAHRDDEQVSPLMYMVQARITQSSRDVGLIECNNDSDVVVDVRSQCRKYSVCKNGTRWVQACPQSTRYSTRSSQCEPAERVPCDTGNGDKIEDLSTSPHRKEITENNRTRSRTENVERTTVTPSSVTDPNSAPPFDCSQKVDGFYADYVRKCHVFYRCLRGRKLSYYCKVGQLFNPKTQICDFEENVVCSH